MHQSPLYSLLERPDQVPSSRTQRPAHALQQRCPAPAPNARRPTHKYARGQETAKPTHKRVRPSPLYYLPQRPAPDGKEHPAPSVQRPAHVPSAQLKRSSDGAQLQSPTSKTANVGTRMHGVRKRPGQRIRGCSSHHFTFCWSTRRGARASGDRSQQRA